MDMERNSMDFLLRGIYSCSVYVPFEFIPFSNGKSLEGISGNQRNSTFCDSFSGAFYYNANVSYYPNFQPLINSYTVQYCRSIPGCLWTT